MTTKSITDIMPAMAQRPRIVIDVKDPDIITRLKILSLERGYKGYQGLVLHALATQYPELAELVKKELK